MTSVKIKGMSCQHCVKSVKEAIEKIDGTANVSVDLDSGMATFEETSPVPDEKIKDAIEKIGFEVVS